MATDYAFEAQSKMEVYGAKYLCKRGDVEVEVEIKAYQESNEDIFHSWVER